MSERSRQFTDIVDVSRETIDRLVVYEQLLHRWQKVKNLVAPSTLSTIWSRHFCDSAQLLQHAPNALQWVDLGSGAGFPGMVLAIALAAVPNARVTLVESDHRKCAFLREVARATSAPAIIINSRIEDVHADLGDVDVVTARALTAMPELLRLAAPMIEKGALGLFLKGQDVAAELTDAPIFSNFTLELLPSLTQPDANIVRVRRKAATSSAVAQ